MSRTIVLTGMKHCGKSTQGRMLAEKLHRNFIDADDVIEQIYARKHNEKLSCREIFRKHGETFFRKLEAEAVQFMMDNNDNQQIIAFGGGAVANPFMPENWRSLGVVVYLAANPLVLYQRIEGRGLPPYLASEPEPYKKFLEITAEREKSFTATADKIFQLNMQDSAGDNNTELMKFIATEI